MKEDKQITKEAAREHEVKIEVSIETTGEDPKLVKAKKLAANSGRAFLLLSIICLLCAVSGLVDVLLFFLLLWGIALAVCVDRVVYVLLNERFSPWWWWW